MVEVLEGSDNITTISWSFDFTGDLTEVLVEYKVGDSTQFEIAPNGNISNTSQLTLDISGQDLLAGETYQFRISATNTEGLSCPNNAISDVLISQIGMPILADYQYVIRFQYPVVSLNSK